MTIICSSCGKPCTGEVLKVQERHFHITCFKCHECGVLLASGGYFPRNDNYFCSKDYHKLFGTKCRTCGDFVEGRVITALGHSYHPQCFKCDRCSGEIHSGTVVTYNDKEEILCQNCSPDVSTGDTTPEHISPPPQPLPSPSSTNTTSNAVDKNTVNKNKTPSSTQREHQVTRSAGSNNSTPNGSNSSPSFSSYVSKTRPMSHQDRRVSSNTSSSGGVPPSPLTTSTSSPQNRLSTTPIAPPTSTSTPSNGPSVDDVFDFSKVPDINPETRPFMGKCAQCQESIRSAQSLIALNRHWHLFCFSCARCKRYLTNEYMDNGDQAYCEPCFQELYGLICETCQEYITGTVLEAGDRHFHPACAFCFKCSLKFGEGDDLCVAGDEVYHLDCERAKTSAANKPPLENNSKDQVTRIRPQSENSTARNNVTDTKDLKGSPRPSTSRQNRFTPDSQAPLVIYPLKELQLVGKVCLPKGVNRTKLEQHLCDADFYKAFSMDRNTFFSKPQWKQMDLKKKANLF